MGGGGGCSVGAVSAGRSFRDRLSLREAHRFCIQDGPLQATG